MKKITLIGCALFLVGAASCNMNENSFTSTSTFKVETYSLVTGSDVEPSVSLNNYTFVTDNYNFKMMMMSNDLNIGGSVKSFSTKEIPMIMGRIRMQGCKNLSQFCLGEAADADGRTADPDELRTLALLTGGMIDAVIDEFLDDPTYNTNAAAETIIELLNARL